MWDKWQKLFVILFLLAILIAVLIISLVDNPPGI